MLQLLSVLAIVAAATASDVLELGDSDFNNRLQDMDLTLVKFYAPWCGHCKKIAPEFEKAATVLKTNDPPIDLVKVDCTEAGKEICNQHGVKGFPTLKAFKNGQVAFEYQGPRDADGIVKYMRSKAGPTAKKVDSVEAAEALLAKPEATIMGFLEEDSPLQKSFQKVADAMNEDFRFAFTYDKDVMDKYNYKDAIVIFQPKVLQNKFEDSEIKYDAEDGTGVAGIRTWVTNNIYGLAGVREHNNEDYFDKRPLVIVYFNVDLVRNLKGTQYLRNSNGLAGVRTTANDQKFRRPLVVVYYEVDYVRNVKGTNYWRNRVMKVAQKLKEEKIEVHFAISNKEDFTPELQEFGASLDSEKPIVTARDASEKKYTMTKEFSMDNLEQFVRDFSEGKLEPYLKSEDIPKDNSGPVKTVVAKNFDEIVNDDTKDVLIEFYAPWCGHCKTLAPKYDELGEKLQKDSNIVIAKMDATANDVPKPYEVSGFPTLYFKTKDKKVKKYEGGREVDDFIKYLAKETTDGLTNYDRNGKKIKKKKADGEL